MENYRNRGCKARIHSPPHQRHGWTPTNRWKYGTHIEMTFFTLKGLGHIFLMCYSTRASVATLLTTQPCVSLCLRVKRGHNGQYVDLIVARTIGFINTHVTCHNWNWQSHRGASDCIPQTLNIQDISIFVLFVLGQNYLIQINLMILFGPALVDLLHRHWTILISYHIQCYEPYCICLRILFFMVSFSSNAI